MVAEEIAQRVFAQLDECGGPRETAQYVAVPGNAQVRWLLPADGKALGNVLASWTPYRSTSRLAWATVKAASCMGAITELPGVSVVEVVRSRAIDWRSLGWRWHDAPIPVVYVGTPGPRRKAVVHLIEHESATCRAVVKVPLCGEAQTAVLHEADVLAALKEEGFQPAPELLHVERAKGLATQSFLGGRPSSRKLEAGHGRLLQSLTLRRETTSLCEHAERWKLEVAGLRLPECVEAAVYQLADDEPLPACWQHGDFTPWNIRRVVDGRLLLLDWEEARRYGLPLCDAFHFLHMQDFLFGKRSRLHAADVCSAARELGIPARMVVKLERAYLVAAYVTSIGCGNEARARFLEGTMAMFQRRAA
jgi:Phosphotransferase enzyme family